MVSVYSKTGSKAGTVTPHDVFTTEYRPDLIQRAVVSIQAGRRSPYGPTPSAGLKTSADYFGRRRGAYRMTINRGMSRLPREKTGGGGLGKVRRVPQSVGGRRSHPPKPEKSYIKKINKKEYLMALRSAIAASTLRDVVEARGHILPEKKDLPIVVEDSIQQIKKTSELLKLLAALELSPDIERCRESKASSGKSRLRGRSKKQKKSVLIVVSEDDGIRKAGSNIPGVDVETIKTLNIEDLAPGTHAGRLVVWGKTAVEKIGDLA
ncbi:MAG: 50S ribosomal protein L4 [Candidatus Altiarchaeota archaeon]